MFTPWRVAWSLFLESPRIFSGSKNCFIFAVFAFKTIVSIILKIQWNYQLTKRNWQVCELRTVVLFNRFWFENLSSGPKSYRAFRETRHWSLILLFKSHHDRKSENSRKIQSFTKIKNKEVWAAPQYCFIPDLASSHHIFKMADVGNTDW